MLKTTLLIVGSGPAGLYAATLASLRKIDYILIESNVELGGQLINLYPEKKILDIPGFSDINAFNFIQHLIEQKNQYAFGQTLTECKLLNLTRDNDIWHASTSKQLIKAQYILLTHGKGSFNPNLLACAGYDHQDNVLYAIPDTRIFADKRIIILGGGDAAVDWANHLKLNSSVSIVHRRPDFRANLQHVESLYDRVNVYKDYTILEIIGNPVYQIKIQSNQDQKVHTLDLDYIIVFYGQSKDNKSNFITLDCNEKGIIVDGYYETSEKNIFSVGDACAYNGKEYVITSALGDVSNVMGHITSLVYPNQRKTYSSLIK